tara:strand:- start:328 stop:480 length:153 start_codon:yes stop_codon:yes gene_type:complete
VVGPVLPIVVVAAVAEDFMVVDAEDTHQVILLNLLVVDQVTLLPPMDLLL